MKDKYNINKILDKQYLHLKNIKDKNENFNINNNSKYKYDNFYLTEEDFYPPFDNRFLKSYVADIQSGDNFADYCKQFFELCEYEDYFD